MSELATFSIAEAREWTARAERAARHLERFPDSAWRRFLESTIAAAQGVVRGTASAATSTATARSTGPRSA